MHPILPAAIMSGLTIAILATFRSRNRLAMSGRGMVDVPRRTATQMALGYIFHHESVLGKQFFRKRRDFLSVLQRTGRVIGDDDVAVLLRRPQIDAADILREVPGPRPELRGRP